jgi:hypothetical protein
MMTRVEQETVVAWNQAEGDAILTTCAAPVLRKLAKAGIQPFRVLGAHKQFRLERRQVSLRLGRRRAPGSNPARVTGFQMPVSPTDLDHTQAEAQEAPRAAEVAHKRQARS